MSNDDRKKLEPVAHLTEEQVKEMTKEAITEWMDQKYQSVGKWTLSSIAVALIGALTYFILRMNGWELTHK